MTKRIPPAIKLVHRAWGPGIRGLSTPMGPLEGCAEEQAEFAIHEMCHAALLGLPLRFACANRQGVGYDIEGAFNRMHIWRADLNEVRTLAAECIVLRELNIAVPDSAIRVLGLKNLRLVSMTREGKLRKHLRLARGTKKVQRAAQQVLAFIRGGPKSVLGRLP